MKAVVFGIVAAVLCAGAVLALTLPMIVVQLVAAYTFYNLTLRGVEWVLGRMVAKCGAA